MKKFIYIIAEGVLDVVFVTEVLRRCFKGEVVREKSALPQEAFRWLKQFKWPVGEDIVRKAVPAPAFVRCGDYFFALRNAQSISNIERTLNADMEAFLRLSWRPDDICIFFDADDKDPTVCFGDFADLLRKIGYPSPLTLDMLLEVNKLRAGIFAFPGEGKKGTREDILCPLATERFPNLERHAERYVQKWDEENGCGGEDFKELRRPAGKSKAVLSSMTALLKPGKSIIASIEDQNWIPDEPECCEVLAPFLRFLTMLLK